MKRILYGALIVMVVLSLGAVVLYMTHSYGEQNPVFQSILNNAKLAALPQKDASGIDTTHVATGVTPPTNKWFSGLALQQIPKTVFPTPLSFTPTDSSFTFDLPSVTTNPSTITTTVKQPIHVSIEGATYYQVTRYDEVSVDLTFHSANNALGTVTLVAGLPYVYYTALGDGALTIDGGGAQSSQQGDALSFQKNDSTTTLLAYDGAHVGGDSRTITVPKGGAVTMYAAKNELIKTVGQYAKNRVESAVVSYKKDGNNFQTTIDYKTVNGQPTYYGRLPHQQAGSSGGPAYNTIYGALVMQAGTALTFTTPQVPVVGELNLSKLSTSDRALLVQTVRQDSNAPKTYPDDSYFGGKAMYRDAQLLVLAKQLGETDTATTVQTRLRDGLEKWFQQNGTGAKSFYYDTKIHGIVGVTPSFGSEAFNDHHFHYGYFIYASGVLARYDADFRSKYQDEVNLLVADIANYRSDEKLPLRRAFDPYFGHSWASGSAPFADGNNQESSSEAINAWVGLDLWARQINNTDLASEADWMLSNEAASTSAYWLDFDSSKAPYVGFAHSLVSLNWGGKRDYATWFSPDPRAMLGIQLIPMSPTMQYMSTYGNRIAKEVKEAQSSGAPAQFDDYILMYESLNGSTSGLLDKAKQLPDTVIDDANSRSYLYAWLMSRQ